MAQIAPWLIPTDVIGAMSRGASAGLSARSEDDSERNAADRLRLAYDQMAQEERRQSQMAAIGQQQAAAKLMLAKQQAESLNQFRQQSIATRNAAQAIQQQRADDLANHYAEMERKASEGKDYGDITTQDLGGGVRAVFRKGSPGLHIVTPKGSASITPNAAANLLSKLPQV